MHVLKFSWGFALGKSSKLLKHVKKTKIKTKTSVAFEIMAKL